MMEAFQAVIIL